MRKFTFLALAGALLAGEAAACNEASAASPARAKANLAGLFSDQDYPAEAVAAREEGPVGFTLDVAPNGRVANCTVTRSSGSPALDEATCRLIRSRARFTPASDSAGEPVADHVAGKIIWKLPAPPPES